MKFRQLAILFFMFSFGAVSYGQGMTLHAGTSSMTTNLNALTPSGTAHTGYHIGADGRLGDGGSYFMIGLQYHNLNFNSSSDFSLKVDEPNLSIIKGKGGFAFRIFKLTDKIQTRLRLMGAIDYFLNAQNIDPTDNPSNLIFNEGVAGLVGGLEVDVFCFTANLEYQKGFFNSVKETSGSSMNFWTFSLGINF